ncbi:nucleotidyltransferase [Vulcanisaeta sp. JCM 16161]|uniref:nucleotidyltransferase n=1 Tax=Vulcanisaeta sp. JCM 16161 TaxID=1295372 RepID=UPI0006D0F84C|nr:nucleotidyltransferase [Vulcanisaeta sp. JCM 16161]
MGSNQSKEAVDLIRKALVKVSSELSKRGIDFILIGSAVLPLLYGIDWNVHDIDIFIINKSTITEPETFEEIARENDWDVGMDMNGMMYYEILVDAQVIRVDLMENILDIYIPEEMIKNAVKVRVDGIEIRSIRLEDLLVLKAREASEEGDEFLSRIAEMLADPESRISIDKEYLKRAINYYADDKDSIERRLEKSGIYLE